jgi:glycine hydroxymethyltransferase
MAEALARRALKDRGEWQALSAGLGAVNGQPATPHALRAMRELGLDLSQHRSQMITARLVRQADYIFALTHSHLEGILYLYPEAATKTFLLREFDEQVEGAEKDIADPIGGPFDGYVDCRNQIESAITALLKSMEQPSVPQIPSQSVLLALGADHAGYALKEVLREHLEKRGYSVLDLGTHGPASVDYPAYGRAVAEAVTSGRAGLGILVCGSGVGVSIAANKVPNARAALVTTPQVAALSRQHNDANILCLGARETPVERAVEIVEAFLAAEFEGGRHERRVLQLESQGRLAAVDPDIFSIIEQEKRRQEENIELIASENFTSAAVQAVQGSVLTNKYAEGYPRKRWYGGCEYVDEAEQLAIDRAKALFGAEHANVQPHSGSGANMGVYFALLKPGDKLLTMDLSHGGHLTHGNKANFSGKFFEIVHYGVRKEDERLDYEGLATLAREHRPKMITVGASAYSRTIDFARIGEIAREIGALLLADIAHIAGLVATGLHPSPIPHADFVTTTTHKTLRGPRGGLILCREQFAKAIDSQIFPGIQGGPLMHVIAAKAVCFHAARSPEFKAYQQQVIRNAAALSTSMQTHGFRIVSGGTDNHLMLVDVGARGLTGKQSQLALDEAGITTNKNTIPFETRSPFEASGVRLGTPAVTTRGMAEKEMKQVGDFISEILAAPGDKELAQKVRTKVRELTARFPLPA